MILQRRSIRLPEYDYSLPGAYFVTLATWKHENLLGDIDQEQMRLSRYGLVADGELKNLIQRFHQVEVDEYIIMPDHVHAILWIFPTDSPVGARQKELSLSPNQPLASPIPLTPIDFSRVSPVGARQEHPTVSPNQPLASPVPPTDSAGEERARLTDSASNFNRDSASPLQIQWVPSGAAAGTLGAIIGAYKSTTARIINGLQRTPGAPVWQRNYYEHVIRNNTELDSIRQYIQANPLNWASDLDSHA